MPDPHPNLLQSLPRDKEGHYIWANPGKVIDRNGRPVDTTGEVWGLQDPTDNINLNWNTLRTAADIKETVKCHIAHIVESQAPRTAHQVFKQLKYCFARLPTFDSAEHITYEVLEGAIAKARVEDKDWHFHYIRKWYQWCEDQGIHGFSGDIASRLYRLRIKINPRGHNVMSLDVEDGPLSHDEHFLVRQAVIEGIGRLKDRVIIMLLLELGSRPVQLVLIEEQDFIIQPSPSGQFFYSLNVPRAKQRTIGGPEKKRRRISPELGQLIEQLIHQNHIEHGDKGLQMPLLCIEQGRRKKLTAELRTKYALHMKVIGFTQRVRGYAESANIVSKRTGGIINLTPLRLRYTFFTMLAEQGASANHMAELADHSNGRSIGIYVSNTSSLVERLNAALGKNEQYVNTINRFLGQLVRRPESEDENTVIRGFTPTLKNLGGIGACGANFLCNLYPPLSCYICPKFQAWIDGPHEELLRELESFVEDLMKRSGNRSDRIPHQLVDVMTSIRQLLRRIEELSNGDSRSEA